MPKKEVSGSGSGAAAVAVQQQQPQQQQVPASRANYRAPQNASDDDDDSAADDKWLKPATKENILYYYLPIQGFVSYSALAVNILNPALMLNITGPKDITNILLINSIIGSNLFVLDSSHLQPLPFRKKIFYSSYNSIMFTFGSVLTWALLRTLLPENPPFNTAVAIASSIGLAKIGRDYLAYLDKK